MSLPGFSFLLVEDDPDDPRLLRLAVEGLRIPLVMDVVVSVPEAVDYLRRQPPFAVLSDVHLRAQSGFELLAWMREQDGLRRLPVLLWTSLPSSEGERKALALGASRYLAKPSDLAGYRRVAAWVAKCLDD